MISRSLKTHPREPRVVALGAEASLVRFGLRASYPTRTLPRPGRMSPAQSAAVTFLAKSSMSSALSGPNGRGMSRSETMVLSPTLTSKQPLRGFSALIVTLPPAALTAASIFAARVLNAPHERHASMKIGG